MISIKQIVLIIIYEDGASEGCIQRSGGQVCKRKQNKGTMERSVER